MPTAAKNVFLFLLLTSAVTATNAAQSPPAAPPAPLPAQLFSAKTVFISNTTGRAATYPGITELTYNEFYAAMKGWGRYRPRTLSWSPKFAMPPRWGLPMAATPANMRNSI